MYNINTVIDYIYFFFLYIFVFLSYIEHMICSDRKKILPNHNYNQLIHQRCLFGVLIEQQ